MVASTAAAAPAATAGWHLEIKEERQGCSVGGVLTPSAEVNPVICVPEPLPFFTVS